MISDRTMWASVALVGYLRNGVPLEDAPKEHVGRSLAALVNCYRMPLDEYWERRIDMRDGAYDAYLLDQAGYTGWEMVPLINEHFSAMSAALADRTWAAYRMLPDKVWDLLGHVTGMGREEWEALPAFCRELLTEKITCPVCECADFVDRFGEPDPMDDPTYLFPNRIDLVFHCPKCGTPVTFDIPARTSRQYRQRAILPKRACQRAVLAVFAAFMALAFYLIFRHRF
jgi:hypothetical protein